MKLTDIVAKIIEEIGVKHSFAVAGGASLHLIDSIDRRDGIEYKCMLHEQSVAMAADAYSRCTGNIGVGLSTSGPGATNLITGIACAYYDSIPVLYITGQVATFRMKGDSGVRQIGFQETDIVEMCKGITKYAVQIDDPKAIRYELEKAVWLAKQGRMGPVLVDIPDDLQRETVSLEELIQFKEPLIPDEEFPDLAAVCELLETSERPILIIGSGVRLISAYDEVSEFIERFNIPFVPTWAAFDLLPYTHPLNVGTFGTHGTRYANFAVQNADLVISIGSRLDTKATGTPPSSFARAAKKIVVDVDENELKKLQTMGDVTGINMDAKAFMIEMIQRSEEEIPDRIFWKSKIDGWKKRYPICPQSNYLEDQLNPYVFSKEFSNVCPRESSIFLDTGCLLPWMMQSFENKKGQRIFHDWNNTAMGWALPASIAGAIANPSKQTICMVGDGSLQMNIQELATVIKLEIPLKIILFNNHGYSMIRQTQDQWFNSRYFASGETGGVADPNFSEIAQAYGFKTYEISDNREIGDILGSFVNYNGPAFCSLNIDPCHRVIPQVRYGRANEDSEPFLSREEFLEEMIIDALPSSLKEGD